jgi:hypothetical protein
MKGIVHFWLNRGLRTPPRGARTPPRGVPDPPQGAPHPPQGGPGPPIEVWGPEKGSFWIGSWRCFLSKKWHFALWDPFFNRKVTFLDPPRTTFLEPPKYIGRLHRGFAKTVKKWSGTPPGGSKIAIFDPKNAIFCRFPSRLTKGIGFRRGNWKPNESAYFGRFRIGTRPVYIGASIDLGPQNPSFCETYAKVTKRVGEPQISRFSTRSAGKTAKMRSENDTFRIGVHFSLGFNWIVTRLHYRRYARRFWNRIDLLFIIIPGI